MSRLLADPALTWYLARATGLVLLVVLTLSTVLGVVSSEVRSGGRVPRFVSTDLHRRVSVLAVALLLAHVLVSVLDGFVDITWLDAVVPFVGTYRPFWLGLGTLATDVLLAVTLTSLLRRHTGPRLWRGVHLTAYAAWPLMVVHGLGTGSDSRSLPVLGVTAGCVAAVLAAAGWRLRRVPVRAPRLRTAAWVGLPLVPVLLVVWAVQGPLAPGWSRRAGTPPPPSVAGQPAAAPSPGGTR